MSLHRLWARWRALLAMSFVAIGLLHVIAATEALAASNLGGWAYIDRNNDGDLAFSNEPQPEFVIGDVKIELFLQTGPDDVLVATTHTDQFGRFVFTGLAPGTYAMKQTQPIEYLDGLDTVGILRSLNNQPVPGGASAGVAQNDAFRDIILPDNVFGDFYTFGERGLLPQYVSKRFLLASAPDLPTGIIPEPTSAVLAIAAVVAGVPLLTRRGRRA
jgi:hypothetical protein